MALRILKWWFDVTDEEIKNDHFYEKALLVTRMFLFLCFLYTLKLIFIIIK
jgi:hypothetical protein